MNIWENMDSRAHRLGILDTKLAQAAAIFFALVIVKIFPQIMAIDIGWFAALSAACAIKPIVTFFGPPGHEGPLSPRPRHSA